MRIALPQRLPQRAVFFSQIADIQLLVNHHPHLGQRKWFQHVIAGPRLHRLNRGFHGTEGRHHHHRQCRILTLDRLQKFQSIHARKLQIGNHEVNGILPQQLQSGLGVPGGESREPVLAKIQLKQPPHLGLILDNQNRGHLPSFPQVLKRPPAVTMLAAEHPHEPLEKTSQSEPPNSSPHLRRARRHSRRESTRDVHP